MCFLPTLALNLAKLIWRALYKLQSLNKNDQNVLFVILICLRRRRSRRACRPRYTRRPRRPTRWRRPLPRRACPRPLPGSTPPPRSPPSCRAGRSCRPPSASPTRLKMNTSCICSTTTRACMRGEYRTLYFNSFSSVDFFKCDNNLSRRIPGIKSSL